MGPPQIAPHCLPACGTEKRSSVRFAGVCCANEGTTARTEDELGRSEREGLDAVNEDAEDFDPSKLKTLRDNTGSNESIDDTSRKTTGFARGSSNPHLNRITQTGESGTTMKNFSIGENSTVDKEESFIEPNSLRGVNDDEINSPLLVKTASEQALFDRAELDSRLRRLNPSFGKRAENPYEDPDVETRYLAIDPESPRYLSWLFFIR